MATLRSERRVFRARRDADISPSPATVLVAGGRGGIGAATVDALAASGLRTISLDKADGVDAANERAVRDFLRTQGRPPLRAVVVLCGRVGSGGVQETSLSAWRSVMRDNLDAAYVVVRESLPLLRASEGDRCIVLMSSVNGRTGGNELSGPAYAAAKAAVIGLCMHLARTLAAEGIRANAVAPGPVDTAMTHRLTAAQTGEVLEHMPLHRVAAPTEIAGAIAFLLSPLAWSMTGAVLDINGGLWMG